ncbi:MAG TPA: AMP-binding protein [Streptosporangiaceae bacterium]|nr:AMP-binding protein [Streptosporangiaceae bacterium]
MADQDSVTEVFRSARDSLLRHRTDYAAARREFGWPRLDEFNWALDWFDVIAREHPDRLALWIVTEDKPDTKLTYAELSARSDQLANWLRGLGVGRGDHVLLMLGNQAPLWEVILAAMKLGAVIIPAATLLRPEDIADRISRGGVRHVITESGETGKFAGLGGGWTPISVGPAVAGWHSYVGSRAAPAGFEPDGVTRGSDPLLLYFTSGTTATPKLVEHSHVSYPAGHLSTMYWVGLQPGDVHLNISSPGWAKHAWSNVYAPWIAQATALVGDYRRFSAEAMLEAMVRCDVTTFCAPPTVWRILIQSDLGAAPPALRECVSAGEPLNPEVIERVRKAWGITVRDGYGQTETTAQIGNTPGQPVKPGSMGRPLPGYEVTMLDRSTDAPAAEGEIGLDLSRRPLGLMNGYRGDPELTAEATRGGYYHTGDVASRDADGYITYVGRTDDVFKASDYLISPFELENVLIEHEAVAEAAVVPSPDAIRLAVPKAYVMLTSGWQPSADTAVAILRYTRERLAPYKRVRRIEFTELPKTISGKIRRVELREDEESRHGGEHETEPGRRTREFWEQDFPGLKG